ncbi:hypothetical protein GOV08_03015 [Candidatus Woesearchaeota archaeon]|nr:hypothetical protein [Candidatus Woesearchaeota archaeon]
MKNAQAATEFLMTYGWMVLVVLIAVGALAYSGLTNRDNYVPGYCFFEVQMPCIELPYYDNGKISFSLKNVFPKTLVITGISVKDDFCGQNINPKVNSNPLPIEILQDKLMGVEFDCDTLKSSFDLVVSIEYRHKDFNFTNSVTGKIKGQVYN